MLLEEFNLVIQYLVKIVLHGALKSCITATGFSNCKQWLFVVVWYLNFKFSPSLES